ncbi:hypothetical protein IEQ34_015990 [Dendrobium chrysotoxum]|uniref:Inositol-pentakisphosphate 2-kinase n=1 Tax=Dendrobium chrysotoxum TaxID=161865 RepID=A0AAV7GKG4_DENCH|nr:hypothetical protein IEQ34_015990 [Dendrobium chrysotoxum]
MASSYLETWMAQTALKKVYFANQSGEIGASIKDKIKVLIQGECGLRLASFIKLVSEEIFRSEVLDRLLAVQKHHVFYIEGTIHMYYNLISEPGMQKSDSSHYFIHLESSKQTFDYKDMVADDRRPSMPLVVKYPTGGGMELWNSTVIGRLSEGVKGANREAENVRRRRSKGELIISEIGVSHMEKIQHVEGKGKEISLIDDCKTPRLLKSSGVSLAKTSNPEASSSGMNIFVNHFGNLNAIPVLDSKINVNTLSLVNKSSHNFVNTSVVPLEKSVVSNGCNVDPVSVNLSKNNVEASKVANP